MEKDAKDEIERMKKLGYNLVSSVAYDKKGNVVKIKTFNNPDAQHKAGKKRRIPTGGFNPLGKENSKPENKPKNKPEKKGLGM